MRILLIWGADYPWDIRIEKFSRALHLKGHEIYLLCRNLKGLPKFESWEYGQIHRLTPSGRSVISYALSFPVFFNPIWLKACLRVIYKNPIDLIIVRDLPLALCGLFAARLTGRPILMDMAENYVALLEDTWRFEPFRIQNILVRNPAFACLIEKVAIRMMNHIFVVVEEAKQRLISKGVPEYKIDIVSNTPDIKFFENTLDELSKSDIRLMQNRYIIVYVGGLEYSRGLEQVVQAMSIVAKRVPESLFLVIGKGNSEQTLRNLAHKLGISNHVKLRGWVNQEKIPAFLKHSSVGIIPHYVTNHTNNTVPNKLFDYMYYGLPIIASACRPIARILREDSCGLTYLSEKDLSHKIIQLRDNNLRKTMALRGQNAVKSRYNWAQDAKILNSKVERLVKINTKNGYWENKEE